MIMFSLQLFVHGLEGNDTIREFMTSLQSILISCKKLVKKDTERQMLKILIRHRQIVCTTMYTISSTTYVPICTCMRRAI